MFPRIHPSLWLFTAILSLFWFEGDSILVSALTTVAFIVIVFIAVYLHEAGHYLTMKHFGLTPERITLHALGGYVAAGHPLDRLTKWQRFWIFFNGPLVNIVCWGALHLCYTGDSQVVKMFRDIHFILFTVNLLPISMLDGGQIRDIFLPRNLYGNIIAIVLALLSIFIAWQVLHVGIIMLIILGIMLISDLSKLIKT